MARFRPRITRRWRKASGFGARACHSQTETRTLPCEVPLGRLAPTTFLPEQASGEAWPMPRLLGWGSVRPSHARPRLCAPRGCSVERTPRRPGAVPPRNQACGIHPAWAGGQRQPALERRNPRLQASAAFRGGRHEAGGRGVGRKGPQSAPSGPSELVPAHEGSRGCQGLPQATRLGQAPSAFIVLQETRGPVSRTQLGVSSSGPEERQDGKSIRLATNDESEGAV